MESGKLNVIIHQLNNRLYFCKVEIIKMNLNVGRKQLRCKQCVGGLQLEEKLGPKIEDFLNLLLKGFWQKLGYDIIYLRLRLEFIHKEVDTNGILC